MDHNYMDIAQFLKESDEIEGIFNPLAEYEAALQGSFPVEDPTYVSDHVYAFLYAVHNKNSAPDIYGANQIHKRLMIGSKINIHEIGQFRRCQVFIGGHVPPRAEVLYYSMANWQEMVRDIKSNPLDNHKKFEYIHPYVDGNGRTGRILWAWDRMRRGLSVKPFLKTEFGNYPEGMRKDAYFRSLDTERGPLAVPKIHEQLPLNP